MAITGVEIPLDEDCFPAASLHAEEPCLSPEVVWHLLIPAVCLSCDLRDLVQVFVPIVSATWTVDVTPRRHPDPRRSDKKPCVWLSRLD